MKKGMFTIILLALTVINLIFNIIIVFTMLPSLKNTNNLVNKVATIIDLDNAAKEDANNGEVAMKDLEVVDVETTVTLKQESEGAKLRYAVITLTVSLNKTDADYASKKEVFDSKKSIVTSSVNTVVSEYTINNVNSKKNDIKAAILLDLKDKFGEKFIYDISFSQFNIQ